MHGDGEAGPDLRDLTCYVVSIGHARPYGHARPCTGQCLPCAGLLAVDLAPKDGSENLVEVVSCGDGGWRGDLVQRGIAQTAGSVV